MDRISPIAKLKMTNVCNQRGFCPTSSKAFFFFTILFITLRKHGHANFCCCKLFFSPLPFPYSLCISFFHELFNLPLTPDTFEMKGLHYIRERTWEGVREVESPKNAFVSWETGSFFGMATLLWGNFLVEQGVRDKKYKTPESLLPLDCNSLT